MTMKYMLLMTFDEAAQADYVPNEDDINAMGAFNQELIAQGKLLAGEGLRESALGARVDYDGDDRTVTDGPFTEAKELVSGFWIIDADDKAEAVEWARRVPLKSGRVEVRRVVDLADFPQDNEYIQQEKDWRAEHGESRTA
jgi:hypothetical protein